MSVTYQFLSFRIIFRTNRISTVFIDRLRHQPEMSHYRNTGTENTFHRTYNFFATFQFQSVRMALFHNPDSRSKTFHLITLVRSERHIHHHHSTFHTTNYGFCMIYHLIESDWKCSHITCHHITGRVAYQNYIHACTVHNLRHSIVVRRQHRYLFASLLHLYKAMSSHFSSVI